MTPEDDVMQAAQYLTAALKGNLHIAMDESRIDQIKKLYAMFDTTAKNFQQRKEKQHPKLGKNTWISARRVREEPATSTRVSEPHDVGTIGACPPNPQKTTTPENHGHQTLSMGGTLELPMRNISATINKAKKRFPKECQTHSTPRKIHQISNSDT